MSADDALDGMHDQNRAIFELAKAQGAEGVAATMAPMVAMFNSPDVDGVFEASLAQLPAADLDILNRRPDIKSAMLADGREAYAGGVDGPAYEVVMFTRPWDFDVAEITVPVVIWHGDDDRNAPLSHAQALAGRIPNAELIVWSGMGHLTSIERGKDILGHLIEVAK
jgi:pimeloyl-ACP methyl ester carboxylesterase